MTFRQTQLFSGATPLNFGSGLSLERFINSWGEAPKSFRPYGRSESFRTSGGRAAKLDCQLPSAFCLLLSAFCLLSYEPSLMVGLLPTAYGSSPPVKIRAKLSIGKKVMIFWKLFNLLPGTIT